MSNTIKVLYNPVDPDEAEDNEATKWFFQAKDEHYTIPLKTSISQYVVANVYSYKTIKGQETAKPLVEYYDNKFIIFSNNPKKIDITKIEKNTAYWLITRIDNLNKRKYSCNFSQYEINDCTYKILWYLTDKFRYKFSQKNDLLIIFYDGKSSRFEIMNKILRDVYGTEIKRFGDMAAQKLDIQNKIESWAVEDPEREECDLKVGVLGLNTTLQYKARYFYPRDKHDTQYMSKIRFTPFLFFQLPVEQKILIIHEFVHCKLGCWHGHDKIFWHLTQYYSGYSKFSDCYRPNEEKRDIDSYDEVVVDIIRKYSGAYLSPHDQELYQDYCNKFNNETIDEMYNNWYLRKYPLGKLKQVDKSKKELNVNYSYKQILIHIMEQISSFVSNDKYKNAQYIIEFYFQSLIDNEISTKNYTNNEWIIVDDISNCMYKMLFAIIQDRTNKKAFILNQLKKVKQLSDVIGNGVDLATYKAYKKKQQQIIDEANDQVTKQRNASNYNDEGEGNIKKSKFILRRKQ